MIRKIMKWLGYAPIAPPKNPRVRILASDGFVVLDCSVKILRATQAISCEPFRLPHGLTLAIKD